MKSNIEKHDGKIKLNPDMMFKLQDTLGLDEASLKQFVDILTLPDEVFDSIYPTYKKKMGEILENRNNQLAIIEQLKLSPVEDLNALKEELPAFINELTNDDGLSENKKDLISSIFSSSYEIVKEVVEGGYREYIPVKIVKLNPDAIIPQYAHPTDAGADVCAVEDTKIEAGETKIVKTGIAVAIPAGYEIQVRPRSGLSLKSGLRIANATGTIDADYRGEIGIIITNTKDIPYVIDKGTKIAQLMIAPTPRIKWEEVSTVEELGETVRGDGGFGSTGQKQS